MVPQHCIHCFLGILTYRSQTPPKWAAAVGLKLRVIPRCSNCCSNISLFDTTYSPESRSAAMKPFTLALTHDGWEKIFHNLLVPQHCITCFLRTPDLSISNYSGVSCRGWIEALCDPCCSKCFSVLSLFHTTFSPDSSSA